MSSPIVPDSISIPTIRRTPPVKRADSLNHIKILHGKQNLMGGKEELSITRDMAGQCNK